MQNIVEFKPKSDKINWNTLIAVIIFHILAVAALFTFSWQNSGRLDLSGGSRASWGIGIGYHRLLTHRGFKTPKWLEYF